MQYPKSTSMGYRRGSPWRSDFATTVSTGVMRAGAWSKSGWGGGWAQERRLSLTTVMSVGLERTRRTRGGGESPNWEDLKFDAVWRGRWWRGSRSNSGPSCRTGWVAGPFINTADLFLQLMLSTSPVLSTAGGGGTCQTLESASLGFNPHCKTHYPGGLEPVRELSMPKFPLLYNGTYSCNLSLREGVIIK